ncbi:MAG: sigma-70 family RNA polymerase sigma factor [Sedimentisphaerales bacterium]|nr:sigma-70 family RNA polymerase sigma factor [Sedimentisphaerales bacterium]
MSNKDEFFSLFLKHNNQLFAFILTLVPNYADAEDLFQDTASILWAKFDQFDPERSFISWARQIAKNRILNYYTRKKSVFQLDEALIEKLASQTVRASDACEQKKAALKDCIKKMNRQDAAIIQLRYHQGVSMLDIANRRQQSVNTLYKRMAFLLTLLHSCIQKTLLESGAAYE